MKRGVHLLSIHWPSAFPSELLNSLSCSPHFAPEGCVFPTFPFFNSGRRSVIPRIFFEFPCPKSRRDHEFCFSQNEIGNGKSEGHSRSMMSNVSVRQIPDLAQNFASPKVGENEANRMD